MNGIKNKTTGIIIASLAILAAAAVAIPLLAQDVATYVGSDTCEMCHEEIRTKMKDLKHDKVFNKELFPDEDKSGCESCHGPGSKHVQGASEDNNKLRAEIINPAKAGPAASTPTCNKCHAMNIAAWDNKGHFTDKTGCITCHKVHIKDPKKDFIMPQDSKACSTCHSKQLSVFAKSKHHTSMMKASQCFDCHNPHLKLDAQVITGCEKCHHEAQTKYMFQHKPVKEKGCGACHNPHYLGTKKQDVPTKDYIPNLCMKCHQTPHLPKGCTMCHKAVHGSNSSEKLLR